MPRHLAMAGRLLRQGPHRIHRRAAPRADVLSGPRLSSGLVRLSEKAVEVLGGLSQSLARVVELPGEAQDQGRAGSAILEEGADPTGHGRSVRAVASLVGDALGFGVGQHKPQRRRR